MKRIAGPYSEDHNSLFKDTKEGPMMMSNFVARITDELVYHDGTKTTTILKIVGLLDCGTDKEPEPLPEITVPASEFASCGWVADKWGMRPIVFPVPSVATELKTAIQLLSKPKKRDIYTHTGWTTVNGKPVYLAANGGMTADGMDASINVELPHELQKFKLVDAMPSADDFADTLRLVNLGPKHVTWPLLLATIRACVGPADFSVHLAGRTGTFKSEISSLFQSFYGTEMDARSLPASWNSTGNALEALAFRTKNALIVVDDFVPQGTSYNVRALQAKADTLIRAQGNQAGRARLTDISSHQATMYPRGIILSTG